MTTRWIILIQVLEILKNHSSITNTSITNTNIILLSIPFRFDLRNSASVNMNILKINKKLSELTKTSPYLNFVEFSNDRNLFTQHGLHRNRLGKDLMTMQIANHILTIFHKNNSTTLCLDWYKPMEDQDLIPDTGQSNIMTRNSGCLRKIPVTRLDDFFMVNSHTCHTNHDRSCKNKQHNVNENNVKFNFYNNNDTELIYSTQLPNRHMQYL